MMTKQASTEYPPEVRERSVRMVFEHAREHASQWVAGALGRPVWALSRDNGCWRWLTGRDDSPWFAMVAAVSAKSAMSGPRSVKHAGSGPQLSRPWRPGPF